MSAALPAPSPADPGSFRDRHSRVYFDQARVLRALSPSADEAFSALEQTRFFPRRMEGGAIVKTTRLSLDDAPAPPAAPAGSRWTGALEHEPVPVVSYPYEWSFSMLQDAAALFLGLTVEALGEGLTTTDATPYNVQFVGRRPTFIDLGSFVPYVDGQPWAPYRQLCEAWLIPLLLGAHKGLDPRPLLRGRLAGVPLGEAAGLFGWSDALKAGVLMHVLLHAAASKADARAELGVSAAKSGSFKRATVQQTVRSLKRLVEKLRWRGETAWQDYAEACPSYDQGTRAEKARLVDAVLDRRRWGTVIDLGANTGEYALLAAPRSEQVIALDQDVGAIDRLYRRLKEKGPDNVLPLAVDVTDPSPALGWRLAERRDLFSRVRGELVLALAVVHHVCISGHAPVDAFVEQLAGLGEVVLVEWVGRGDPMVERLLRLREGAFPDYTQATFEASLETLFDIEERWSVGQDRTLYLGRRRAP